MIVTYGKTIFQECEDAQALVCTTNLTIKRNGDLVMGAGIAKEFAIRWPHLPKDWGNRVAKLRLRDTLLVSYITYTNVQYGGYLVTDKSGYLDQLSLARTPTYKYAVA